MNIKYFKLIKALSVVALFFSALTAVNAAEIQWQGFIAQGLIKTSDDSFVAFDDDISTHLTELGINANLRIAPAWRIAGQVVYLDGGNRYPEGARLDYVFVDWNFYSSLDWQANLYLGRFKNQHWLYSSTRDVPFTRPSIVLPQSIYFDAFRDIAVSSDGVALQARHNNAFGDFTLNWSYGAIPLSKDQHKLLLGRQVKGRTKLDYDHKASVFWQPDFTRFSFGISLLDSEFHFHREPTELFADASFAVQRIMLSVRFQQELWELALELQQERLQIDGFFATDFSQDQFAQGGYLLLQYRPTLPWRLYGYVEYSVNNKDDRQGKHAAEVSAGLIPAYFGYQHTLASGINYDFTANFSLSAEIHWVKGVGRLSPVIIPDLANNSAEYWQLYALQLVYRF